MSYLVLILGLVLATAQGPQVRGFDTGGVAITDHASGREGEAGRSGGTTAERSAPNQRVYAYWAIVYLPEGFCRQRRFTTDPDEARAFNYVYDRRSAEANELANLSLCPTEPGAAAPAPQPPSPGELARDFWDVRHLPAPEPKVVPGYAVVGKRVYLELAGRPRTSFDVPNPIGPQVRIDATSRYVVDWDDGTTTTTASQGGPWPHGDVTHVYDTARPRVTIRVTQVWSATWTAGPAGGGLDDLRTAGEVTLAVEQVQPVRNR